MKTNIHKITNLMFVSVCLMGAVSANAQTATQLYEQAQWTQGYWQGQLGDGLVNDTSTTSVANTLKEKNQTYQSEIKNNQRKNTVKDYYLRKGESNRNNSGRYYGYHHGQQGSVTDNGVRFAPPPSAPQ